MPQVTRRTTLTFTICRIYAVGGGSLIKEFTDSGRVRLGRIEINQVEETSLPLTLLSLVLAIAISTISPISSL